MFILGGTDHDHLTRVGTVVGLGESSNDQLVRDRVGVLLTANDVVLGLAVDDLVDRRVDLDTIIASQDRS